MYCPIKTISYADDFVVIAKERWIELKDVIGQWCMDKMGAELSKNSHN